MSGPAESAAELHAAIVQRCGGLEAVTTLDHERIAALVKAYATLRRCDPVTSPKILGAIAQLEQALPGGKPAVEPETGEVTSAGGVVTITIDCSERALCDASPVCGILQHTRDRVTELERQVFAAQEALTRDDMVSLYVALHLDPPAIAPPGASGDAVDELLGDGATDHRVSAKRTSGPRSQPQPSKREPSAHDVALAAERERLDASLAAHRSSQVFEAPRCPPRHSMFDNRG